MAVPGNAEIKVSLHANEDFEEDVEGGEAMQAASAKERRGEDVYSTHGGADTVESTPASTIPTGSDAQTNPKKKRPRTGAGIGTAKRRKRLKITKGDRKASASDVAKPDSPAEGAARRPTRFLDGVELRRKDHKLKYKVLCTSLDKLTEERALVQAELAGTERRIHKMINEKNYLLDQLLVYEQGDRAENAQVGGATDGKQPLEDDIADTNGTSTTPQHPPKDAV